jgi:phosphoenolpyruvate carboxykinase (ATP)
LNIWWFKTIGENRMQHSTSTFNLEDFAITAQKIWNNANIENRLLYNPSDLELRQLVEKEPGVKKTVYGNLVAESEPTSRAALFTKNSVDSVFGTEEQQLLFQCEKVLANNKLISLDLRVGNSSSKTTARLIIPAYFAHVAYGGKRLFSPVIRDLVDPTYQVLFFSDEAFETNKMKPLPQKDITIRLAMLNDGRVIKIVRNSNYIGEFKKAVFASEDWNAKIRNKGIFLHAGCREDYLQSSLGEYRKVRSLFLALSANGKTTTTSRIIARKGRETSWLIQDDGGTLMRDGSFRGFEAGGIFVKTEDVNPGTQREIFYGLLNPDTILENVHVTENGDLDFYNTERTSNGRAVILRRDLMHASTHIDLDRIDNLCLITRGPLIPAIAKLNLEQAVALMIIGQAMESSAGDPTRIGEIRSEFFYDPFVAGDRADHANRFFQILKRLPHLNYYLLNTGGVGEGNRYKEITLEHTMHILDSLLRGGFDGIWVDSSTGFQVPKAIRMVDNIYLHPERLYSIPKFEERQEQLNNFRRKAIDKIGKTLNKKIRTVFS